MTVLEALETAVVELDPRDRIHLLNGAAEQCFAVRRERVENAALERLDGVPDELLAAVRHTREDQRTRRVRECRLEGGLYDCTIHLRDDGHMLLECYDLEWTRQKHQLELRELQTGLLDLLRRNLGHEIRSPLGGIRGAAQMMAAELQEQELGTLAQLIMREVDRIDELIQRFWQPATAHDAVDIHRTLEETLDLVVAEMAGDCEIQRDYDPSIPGVRGDDSALRRVFLNLLRNAWQAHAGLITVRTRIEHGTALLSQADGAALRVDVEDDGEGVPEQLRPLLFLPMVTGRRDGTGLGLALAQQIAASHGGLLTYEALEPGSRFSLLLPISAEREHVD